MSRYLLLPWRPAPLLLVAVLTLGIDLALFAGFVGIAIAALLLSWFCKYCFAFLDAVIAGDEPPVLSIEMVNPLDELRPLALAILIVAGYLLVIFIGERVGRPAMLVTGALLLGALPASIAALALRGNPLHAASPVAIGALVRGMGRDYAGLLIAALACGGALYALERLDVRRSLLIALGQLALLTVFALIGGAVHENRFALGVPTRTRAERRAEREQREHEAERERMLDRSFTHLRLGRTADAWSEVEQWIGRHCSEAGRGPARTHVEYPALIESAGKWDNPAVADRLTSDYLARLLALRENGKALEVLEQRLAVNPLFRPAPPAQSARLRELAGLAGKRALQRTLTMDPPPASSLVEAAASRPQS
ncbi:MAG: hypothetical protein ACREUG_07340 [Steroidobacteraceae bacterium]